MNCRSQLEQAAGKTGPGIKKKTGRILSLKTVIPLCLKENQTIY
jgi:hypothetical protein